MRQFNPHQLQTHLAQTASAPVLVDVREPWEFAICRIEGSINVPMGQIPKAMEPWDRNQETVVICHHGVRSAQVGHFLEQAGFTNIINLMGGVDGWSHDVDPQMARY